MLDKPTTSDTRPTPLPSIDDHEDGQTVQDAGAHRAFFTILPNVVLTLGLSPYALALYMHLKKVTGEGGVCFKKTATLASELNMSAGSISAAKKELAEARPSLLGKSLITIREQRNRGGGKPRHHITITDIWGENFAAFTKPEPISPEGEASSNNEIARSSGEQAISSGEIKKNPSEENPSEKDHSKNTHTPLRAVGAPAERVCVVGKFPTKTYERYARNHQADIHKPVGWASTARRTGEWDERVAGWCAEHAIDPRTGDSVGTPGEDAALAATPSSQPTLDAANCPDCEGRMMRPVAGPGDYSKGVTKCRHDALLKQGAA